MSIEEKFEKVAIKHNKIILYHSKDVIKVIEECRCQNRNIYGIDAFKLYENNAKIQPFMEYSIDFSIDGVIGGYWDESIEFIKGQTDEELVFEIVYEQQKTLNAKKKIVIGAIFVIAILMIFLYFGLHGTIWGISKSENSTSEYLDEWIIQLIGLIIIFAIVIFAFGISVIRKKKADKKLDEDTRQRNKKVNRYFIVWIIIFAILVNINEDVAEYYIICSISLLILFYVLILFVARVINKNGDRVKIEHENLMNYCDALSFIRILKIMRVIFCWHPKGRYGYGELLIYAYTHLGEFEKAKIHLKILKNNRVVKKDVVNKIALYALAIELFLTCEEFENAKNELQNFEELLNVSEISQHEKENNLCYIQWCKRKIDGFEGKYSDLELLLLDKIKTTEINLMMVVLKYDLAKVYLKMNRKEEAMELLDYVLKNGGNTYYAKESKKLIF